MSGVSYTVAHLLGTLLECVMYGIFVPPFIATCYVQWENFSKRGNLNRLIASATVFFGLTVTANLVILFIQAVLAILAGSSGAAILLFVSPPTPTEEIVWFVLFQLRVVVADVIIVYRMYHIYDRNPFVCVLPSITIAASLAAGCGMIGQLLNHAASLQSVLNWSTTSFCITIFFDQSWRVHRATRGACIQVEDLIILRAMKVLIESAALWTTFATMNFIAFLAKSNLTYTFSAASSPTVGISFCLIIVRLGHVLPTAREETWDVSVNTPALRMGGSGQVAVSFPQIKVQRDVYVSESKGFRIGALEAQELGCVNSSVSLPKIFRPSHSVSTLT